MGIFSALFSSKPKQPAPAVSPASASAKVVRPSEPQRVVATSGVPVGKSNAASALPKPVANAAVLQMPQPVLPRSITQRLSARPALAAPRSNEPIRSAEPNGTHGEVTLSLGDVLPQIPPTVLDENAPVDLSRTLRFSMAQLSAEMARGRPAVPLASVAQQCPELFRQPESINETEMVRLPLQKLLEQIGKLKRIDFAEPPRALPPAPSAEVKSRSDILREPAPVEKAEPAPLPSWLHLKPSEDANGHSGNGNSMHPATTVERPATPLAQPFVPAELDRTEVIPAEIIEIVPELTRTGRVEDQSEEKSAVLGSIDFEPLAGARLEDYEVPVAGEAPVVEMGEADDAVLDHVDCWPMEYPEEAAVASMPLNSPSQAQAQPVATEALSEVFESAVPPPLPPPLPIVKISGPPMEVPVPATVQTTVEPGPFIVVGPVIPRQTAPLRSLPPTARKVEAPKDELPLPAPVAENIQSEVIPSAPTAPEPAAAKPANPAPVPAPSAPAATAASPDFIAFRNASAPIIPRFPLRAPRSVVKSMRSTAAESDRPTPPRSPLLSFLPEKKGEPETKRPNTEQPRLFGANPLDRYFSTKVSPPVNWSAVGALLSVTGEVTPKRIADAIVNLPGIRACLLAAPPILTVAGEWMPSMSVDGSLAFGRRLAAVLKQGDSSIVAHRRIATEAGALLVFSIDDLLICAVAQANDVPTTIRQKLLVVAKAMAHARQSVRKSEGEEL